jgi:hypothetical protein
MRFFGTALDNKIKEYVTLIITKRSRSASKKLFYALALAYQLNAMMGASAIFFSINY